MRPIARPWAHLALGLSLGLWLLGGAGCIDALDPGAVVCDPSGGCPAGYGCEQGRCYPFAFGQLPATGSSGGSSSGASTSGASSGTTGGPGSSGSSGAGGSGGSTGHGSSGSVSSASGSSSGGGSSGGSSSASSGGSSGGNGSGNGYASTLPAVYESTSQGQAGLLPGLDGGVSVGVFPTFSSDFFYVANGSDGTVSRVVAPISGAPYEQARYPALVPIDNHGLEPTTANGDSWQVGNQYSDMALNSPGGTVVDRRGSAWVLIRAPAFQSGVTEIADVGDHLADCVPRCHQRAGLAAGQAFTEGVPLQVPGGAQTTLSPPGVIAPGSAYATSYACQDPGADPTGKVVTDPRNYDDCALLSIPLGDPNPDPFADPSGQTRGLSFARASAVAPDCDPVSGECDIWIGMWNGGAVIRLAYASPAATGAPFDVADVIGTGGANPFSATIDCSGLLWTGTIFGNLTAITTRPLVDLDAGLSLAARTLVTPQGGIPNSSQCGLFDIGADVGGRLWMSSFTSAPWACAFDTRVLLADEPGLLAGTLAASTFTADLQAAWTSYDLSAQWPGGDGHGLAVDVTGNVYLSSTSLVGAVAFNPDTPGSVPCVAPGDAGAGCANGAFLWPAAATFGTLQAGAAIDLDSRGNVWLADYDATAVDFDGSDGSFLNAVAIGNGVESGEPSDFTGRFSRTFAPSPGLYSQTFTGCADGGVDTGWSSVGYSAKLPAGSDLSLSVVTSGSPSGAGGPAIPICQSVQLGNCANGACTPCGNPIPLAPFGVPASPYLTVVATITPQVCGASPANAPVLFDLSVNGSCP